MSNMMKKCLSVCRSPFFVPCLIQLVIAYEWIAGGWGKVIGGTFSAGMTKTLVAFGSKNPHAWYVNSVLEAAKKSPELFGQLVQWGELLAGIGLVVSVILYLFVKARVWQGFAKVAAIGALIGGAFMSLNFYLAAGWTSPSTGGLNLMMLLVQVVLIMGWSKEKRLS